MSDHEHAEAGPFGGVGTYVAAMHMTLRDYFAAMAMAAPWAQAVSQNEPAVTVEDCAALAADCYTMADAMLKARRDD